MTVKANTSEDKKHLSIIVEDRFDFSQHQYFRDAYNKHNEKGTLFSVDLSKTVYMDSSALGMILLLKDYAESLGGKMVIKNPSETVNKILEIVQFHRLITIEH